MSTLSNQTYSEKDAEATSKFYDAIHITYENVGVFSEKDAYVSSFGRLRDAICSHSLEGRIRGGHVLDAGCGAWQKGVRILNSFDPKSLVAVDFNEQSLAHCRENPQKNTTYIKQDLAKLDFQDETFDFIICEGVVHHTIDPVQTLDELLRVLKSNGHLTLGVYCWRFPYTALSWILKRTVGKIGDVTGFLKFARQNKLLLLLADFIFVPIEHTIKEKRLLEYLRSKNCEIIHNDMMLWPVPMPEPFSRILHRLSGLNYRHIIVKKQTTPRKHD